MSNLAQLTGPSSTQPQLGNLGLPEVVFPEDSQPPTSHQLVHLRASSAHHPRPQLLQIHLFATQTHPSPPIASATNFPNFGLPEDDFPEDNPTSNFPHRKVGIINPTTMTAIATILLRIAPHSITQHSITLHCLTQTQLITA